MKNLTLNLLLGWTGGFLSRGEVAGKFATVVSDAIDDLPEELRREVLDKTIGLLTAKRDGTPTFTIGG